MDNTVVIKMCLRFIEINIKNHQLGNRAAIEISTSILVNVIISTLVHRKIPAQEINECVKQIADLISTIVGEKLEMEFIKPSGLH